MKRIVLAAIFCGVVCLSLLSGCAVQPLVDRDMVVSHPVEQAEISQVLENGDWIVIRGVTGPDNFIATVTNTPLSHASIYDAENNQIIEADSTGVHTTPLVKYMSKAHRLLVIRPMWADRQAYMSGGKELEAESNAREAVELARSWLGKPYNYTGLVGVNVPDRYYCTQLALMSYKPAMDRIKAGHGKGGGKPKNPLPLVIEPGQMYHWGRIVYDSGPYHPGLSAE